VQVSLLGPLEIMSGTRELTPTAPKVRQVLALLALRQNRIVQTTELIDELWGARPPRSALTTLQTYIYLLRKIFSDRGPANSQVLCTKPYGYLLAMPPESLDQWRFEQLAMEGRAAVNDGQPEQAAQVLSRALSLWRGPALADVCVGELLAAHAIRLDEDRLQALELRLEADLQLGRHQELISELKAVTAAHPLHEGLHAKLMLTLYRSGRRHEALELYQRLRKVLVRELGLEPSTELRGLHQAVLAADPSLDIRGGTAVITQDHRDRPGPAQLPMDIADFTARQDVLGQVEQCLLAEDVTTAVPIVAITGMPGVGKTALAIHAAQRLRASFCDGQFYAELGGTRREPADPLEVLGQFLRAAGIAAERIPATLDERSAMFRTWVADRRVLVVLDDLASAAGALPLLPGSARCAVIATGRTCGLPGARTVLLDVLSTAEGTDMLANIVGDERVRAERAAASEIVRMCGGLPLAVRAAAARLVATPGWPLRRLARQLADKRGRLTELCRADLDVRARYDSSYSQLDEPERSAFQALSLLPAGVFAAGELGRLLGCEAGVADAILVRLAERHLLHMAREEPDDVVRYAFHELTRLYARERLDLALKALGGTQGRGTPQGDGLALSHDGPGFAAAG
jgi:DNA-binding SARP family transcriptional activator